MIRCDGDAYYHCYDRGAALTSSLYFKYSCKRYSIYLIKITIAYCENIKTYRWNESLVAIVAFLYRPIKSEDLCTTFVEKRNDWCHCLTCWSLQRLLHHMVSLLSIIVKTSVQGSYFNGFDMSIHQNVIYSKSARLQSGREYKNFSTYVLKRGETTWTEVKVFWGEAVQFYVFDKDSRYDNLSNPKASQEVSWLSKAYYRNIHVIRWWNRLQSS